MYGYRQTFQTARDFCAKLLIPDVVMTAENLIEKLSATTGIPMETVAKTCQALADSVAVYVKDMDEVAIPAFGTFLPVKNQERVVRDSKIGHKTLLPPSIEVVFKPSVVLRKRFVG